MWRRNSEIGFFVLLLWMISIYAKDPSCQHPLNLFDSFSCFKELTDWMDVEVKVFANKTQPEIDVAPDENEFKYIEITAFPVRNKLSTFKTHLCIDLSSVTLFFAETVYFHLSSRTDPSKTPYTVVNVIRTRDISASEILEIPTMTLACLWSTDLLKADNEDTIELQVWSTKKSNNDKIAHYAKFSFRIPNWEKLNNENIYDLKKHNECPFEPFIYVNSTYQNYDKIVIKSENCSSTVDLKLTKYSEKTNKPLWTEQINDVSLETPTVYWQSKDKDPDFYYRVEIAHLDNLIPKKSEVV